MSGDINLGGNRIKTNVPFGIRRVTKKNARSSVGLKFVGIVWFK